MAMVGRTALKVLFFLVAACFVVLSFVVIGELTLRVLRPADRTARLKLETFAANTPVVFTTADRPSPPALPAKIEVEATSDPALPPAPPAKLAAEAAPDPGPPPASAATPAAEAPAVVARTPAQTPPFAVAPPANPFADVGDGKAQKPTLLTEPLGYTEPPDPSGIDPPPAGSDAQKPADTQATASQGAASQGTAPAETPPASAPGLPAAGQQQASLMPQPAADDALAKPGVAPSAAPADVEVARHATFKSSLDEILSTQSHPQSLRIVQIGDSHTAADMFTGEVRQKLQSAFGDGGAGYLDVGKPHPGVRSDILKMNTSPGWTYTAIQRTDDASQFRLSGFNAIATKAGETLTLSTGTPISFDSIDIAVKHGPESGAIELRFDNDPAVRFDLKGPKSEWWFLRATSLRNHVEQLKQLTITTLDARPVDISSVAIFNESYGVSYSAIGFPGATIDIVNKFPAAFFSLDLQRINPQIVVLSFGTNEGFDDALDIPRYGDRYQNAINRIRAAVPHAEIVITGPANSNRLPHACRGEAGPLTCRPPQPGVIAPLAGCFWQTPPKLDRVREMQKLIAEHDRLHFWNWSEIQAPDCGAHQWATASPRLMQPDHVHFTAEGYRIGADKFAEFLMPIIDKLRRTNRVVSNN